jgi:hypothetical protein
MDLLGISASWVSTTGLLIDAVGVALLTWDLYPDFRLTRELRDFRFRSRDFYSKLVGSSMQRDDREIALAFLRGDPAEIRTVPTKDILRVVGRAEMSIGLRERFIYTFRTSALRRKRKDPEGDYLETDDLSLFLLSYAIFQDADTLEKLRENAGHRIRPPLIVVTLSIVLGFLLQTWGTIPLEATSVSHFLEYLGP